MSERIEDALREMRLELLRTNRLIVALLVLTYGREKVDQALAITAKSDPEAQ